MVLTFYNNVMIQFNQHDASHRIPFQVTSILSVEDHFEFGHAGHTIT